MLDRGATGQSHRLATWALRAFFSCNMETLTCQATARSGRGGTRALPVGYGSTGVPHHEAAGTLTKWATYPANHKINGQPGSRGNWTSRPLDKSPTRPLRPSPMGRSAGLALGSRHMRANGLEDLLVVGPVVHWLTWQGRRATTTAPRGHSVNQSLGEQGSVPVGRRATRPRVQRGSEHLRNCAPW